MMYGKVCKVDSSLVICFGIYIYNMHSLQGFKIRFIRKIR